MLITNILLKKRNTHHEINYEIMSNLLLNVSETYPQQNVFNLIPQQSIVDFIIDKFENGYFYT